MTIITLELSNSMLGFQLIELYNVSIEFEGELLLGLYGELPEKTIRVGDNAPIVIDNVPFDATVSRIIDNQHIVVEASTSLYNAITR